MEHRLLAAVNIAPGYARLVGKLGAGYRRVITAYREGALRYHFAIGSTLNEVSSLLYHSQVEGKAGQRKRLELAVMRCRESHLPAVIHAVYGKRIAAALAVLAQVNIYRYGTLILVAVETGIP